MEHKAVCVFISSTFEDFQEERRVVSDAILDGNKFLNSFGISLVPVDMRNGARPNPPLDECLKEVSSSQFLIGLIGSRYGYVDNESGKSICELEYDKAVECNIPVLMYCATYAKVEWTERNPTKLGQLVEFKAKVERSQKRDEFGSKEELRGHVIRDLPRCIIESYLPHPEKFGAEAVESPKTSVVESASRAVSKGKELAGSAKEIKAILESIGENIGDLKSIEAQTRRRFLLFAASMFYDTELSGTLGTHEIQLLYRDRDSMSLLGREQAFLARNVFGDFYGVKAGWFWLRRLKSKDLLWYLQWMCENERDEDLRIGCVNLLKCFWSDQTEKTIRKNVVTKLKRIRLRALKILEELGSLKSLSVVDKAETDTDTEISKAARRSKFGILGRSAPSKAASCIMQLEDESIIESEICLDDIVPKVAIAELTTLVEHKSKIVRQSAKAELARRGKLDNAEMRALTKESAVELKYLGYKGLIDKGEEIDINELKKNWHKDRHTLLTYISLSSERRLNQIIEMILKNYPTEKLTKSLSWLNPDKEPVYVALGRRKGRGVLNQVREDLENNFERIKKAYLGKLNRLKVKAQETGDSESVSGVQKLVEEFWQDENQKYGEQQFTKAALKLLIEYAEEGDIRFAKRFLASDDNVISELAKELFIQLAKEPDVSKLVEIALNSTGKAEEQAGEKALMVDKKGGAVETFLNSNSSTLIRVSLKEKLRRKEVLDEKTIQKLLLSESVPIREITLAYVLEALRNRRPALEEMLDRYLNNKRYYYNVVCWLDRVLYAPRTFKMLFRKQLSCKLD